jgi:hypothetical protein
MGAEKRPCLEPELFECVAWAIASAHATPRRLLGNRADGIQELRADLYRFLFLLGTSDGAELFGGQQS